MSSFLLEIYIVLTRQGLSHYGKGHFNGYLDYWEFGMNWMLMLGPC